MFTGIIEEIGKIQETQPIAGGVSLKIEAKKILEDISVNDSICIDGVCLTATKIVEDGFWVDAVGATLEKTTFAGVKSSTAVNLERSVRLNDRLGGHLVQGHVNGIGTITELNKIGENYLLKIYTPDELEKYLIKEGSIAINGISLTIADLIKNQVVISVIPHTWQNTTLQLKHLNHKVNVEIDILAKYVEKLLAKRDTEKKIDISENWLKELGY
jgi:riboflavin synthase